MQRLHTLFFCVMKPEFTNEQARKMHDILVEIHSTLKDKSKNMNAKPNLCERAWLLGIGELLNELDETAPNNK